MAKFGWIMTACAVFFLIISATKSAVPPQTFTVLASLDASNAGPHSALVQAAGGKLYGTATQGGGHGSIFTITPAGVLTVLHLFKGAEGGGPGTGVIQGTDGSFYGTAGDGGANARGTVFKITASGTLTVLYSFCPHLPCSDGEFPAAGLVQASDGNFYGTTLLGGHSGNGTVFKITPSGVLTTLHKFDDTDGGGPSAALIQGSDGNLYGTTAAGGTNEKGTVFKITTSGVLTIIHLFNGSDGLAPVAALFQGIDGNFYGTASSGGKSGPGCGSGCGTIFKITLGGNFTTLHEFDGTDGRQPEAPLILASGNLYGTTFAGGTNDDGTVFRIMPTGNLTSLYSFCSQSGCPDGKIPYGLVQYTNGKIYGTTLQGGANNDGTIYSLSLGLRPFVRTLPIAGQVGTTVTILGTNLTETSSVTFNGTPATFIVKSRSAIKTTVPPGATTGTVQVVTPARTLSSNIPFQVLP